jgi:ABC-type branched-subunit amino acid transport system substrate-binding protein
MDGAFFPSFPLDTSFIENYRVTFGTDLQIAFAGNAYDFFSLLAAALKVEDSSLDLFSQFLNQLPYTGKTGHLRLLDSGNESPLVIKQIKGTEIKPIL